MSTSFSPIAIVGRACRVPGANSPEELWSLVSQQKVAISDAPAGRWRVPDADVLSAAPAPDHTYSKRGGYVDYARAGVDPNGLDPVFQLASGVTADAFADAGPKTGRAGLVLGNLSFPSAGHSRYAESLWFGGSAVDPSECFHSGLPAHRIASALGLEAGGYCIDAACASSLYAIELACRRLQDHEADMMAAGAVCCADDLFIHVGFSALGALSKTGQSRPFHAEADGLLPGEGAAMVVLMRLEDARAQGRTIHGVIRGVGLANDGRGRGLLAPLSRGQVDSMSAALTQAGLSPGAISYVECHATGTTVGDRTELESLEQAYQTGGRTLPVSSLKGNLGHLITAAGAAGLIKTMEAMRHGVLPPVPQLNHVSTALSECGCRVVDTLEPWVGDKRAGVSAFGFGGNDAHLIVEEERLSRSLPPTKTKAPAEPIVVVALGARVGNGQSAADLLRRDLLPRAELVRLPLRELRFPPNDLKHTLSQQTLLLAATFEALAGLSLPHERTGVFVGMSSDSEVTRYGARWRAKEHSRRLGKDVSGDTFIHELAAAGVIGTMPNIPANRLSSQFDLRGPSFTLSAEQASGLWALSIAHRALRAGELDAAVVGAVDLASDSVTKAALIQIGVLNQQAAADAAVCLVLMRAGDASAAGLRALCEVQPIAHAVGSMSAHHAHAAAGLVNLAQAAVLCATVGGQAHQISGDALGAPIGSGPSFEVQPCSPPSILPAWQPSAPVLELPAHPAPLPVHAVPTAAAPTSSQDSAMQSMPPAPPLPPKNTLVQSVQQHAVQPTAPQPAAAPTPLAQPAPTPAMLATQAPNALMAASLAAYQAQLASMHQAFIAQQTALHQQFLAMRQHASFMMMQAMQGAPAPMAPMTAPMAAMAPATQAPVAPAPVAPVAPVAPAPVAPVAPVAPAPVHAPRSVNVAPKPLPMPTVAAKPNKPTKRATVSPVTNKNVSKKTRKTLAKTSPIGPSFDRADLLVHSGGKISTLFGPLFEQQDGYDVQVRMPEPPLLLADRVTGIDAEPGGMKRGTVWTETDVKDDSWYLHRGRMPAGVMIESGQADLFLISYLGIDFTNKGERAYRLLGCELTYHGSLPKAGETLAYDIHVDGHANQGPIRLFFFHYDCELRGPDGVRPALSVRGGQAGFFNRGELDDSAGILWTPEEQEIVKTPRLDPPAVICKKTSFNEADLNAFSAGDVAGCFGPGFEYAAPHNRTPRVAGNKMHFFDRVDECSATGGPWGRGYLKATLDITPEDWFFVGHFKNDPCMPGTLMFEGCLQAMATFMTSLGYTLDKDGWRFEPIPEEKYQLLCRGQVLPSSKVITYEIFVEEVIAGPIPMVYADLLCTVDGLKAFHTRRMGLQLVPDWPLEEWRETPPNNQTPSCAPQLTTDIQGAIAELAKVAPPSATAVWAKDPNNKPFLFDYASLLACAWGRPSDAFGPMYARFDSTRRVARLPGPPYHFMSRVTKIDGPLGECKPGAEIIIEYDVPESVWYFDENAQATMPFCVLLEAALQPCGWLASFVGSALTVDKDLSFRNLDGKGTVLTEVFPASGTFRTVVKITNVSATAGMIIQSFTVRSFVDHADGTSTPAYELDTVFGFFPGEALQNQIGLPVSDEQRAQLEAPSAYDVDLTTRPERYCAGDLRLANPMLLMVDRITAFEAKGGRAGLGFIRGEKDVVPSEWFFKAHFFQDPVQPGSLGIEAFLQLLQYYAIDQNLGEGMKSPRFEAITVGHEHSWKYRGQVVPKNKVIGSTAEILSVERDERGVCIIGAASLWVDGKRIYEAPAIGIRVVDAAVFGPHQATDKGTGGRDTNPKVGDQPTSFDDPNTSAEILSITSDPWVLDHRPTFTVAALPLMSLVDRFIAASGQDPEACHLRNVRVKRWVTVDPEARLKVERKGDELTLLVWRDARDPKMSRFEIAATATVGAPTSMPAIAALVDHIAQPNPYESGALFHGPAFQLLKELREGQTIDGQPGAISLLDAAHPAASAVPRGVVFPALLDAATHAIPHDALHTWTSKIGDDLVAYPYELDLTIQGPAPQGQVRCDTRLIDTRAIPGAPAGTSPMPVFRIDLFDLERKQTWARLLLTEVLLPKGPIGSAPRPHRRRFLDEKKHICGMGLSILSGANVDGPDETHVDEAAIRASDWLPGTVAALYGSDASDFAELARDVVIKDHVGTKAHAHPSVIDIGPLSDLTKGSGVATLRSRPLRAFPFHYEDGVVTGAGLSPLDLSSVQEFWQSRFGLREWPIADLYYGLVKQFVRDVVLDDPDAFAAIEGQSVLFLANHQTGIESLLFGILAGALQKTPVLTLAKDSHQDSWLGRLIKLGFEYPGAHDPGVIAFFDRTDPSSLPRIVQSLSAVSQGADKRSLLVHVEGTRALSAQQPMGKMSGVFVDLALKANMPIVPVAFSGGLPVEPVEDRLEFPVDMGQQTFRLGKPLLPSELSGLTYKDRNEYVFEAIRSLRKSKETPRGGDAAFAARVGGGTPHEVARAILEQTPDPSSATHRLLGGDFSGAAPEDRWLLRFAAWLRG